MKSKSLGRFLAMLVAMAIMIGVAGFAEDIGMEQGEQISSEDKGTQTQSGNAEKEEPAAESQAPEEDSSDKDPVTDSFDEGGEPDSSVEDTEPDSSNEGSEADTSDEGSEADGPSAEQEVEQNVAASGAEGGAKEKGDVVLDARALSLVEGQTWRLHAVTFDKAALHWSSNNAGVASVDANGLVMANSPGSSTIYASIEGGQRASCEVTVFPLE